MCIYIYIERERQVGRTEPWPEFRIHFDEGGGGRGAIESRRGRVCREFAPSIVPDTLDFGERWVYLVRFLPDFPRPAAPFFQRRLINDPFVSPEIQKKKKSFKASIKVNKFLTIIKRFLSLSPSLSPSFSKQFFLNNETRFSQRSSSEKPNR